MPETFPQWLWFTFFFVGALGGWLAAGVVAFIAVQELRFRRFMSKAKK